ncbi:MAG: peptidylprolyl isomerase [Bacteroidota bacterium]
MKNLIKGLVLTLVIAFAVSSAVAQKSIGKKVLVTIGDEQVRVDEFTKIYEKNNTQSDLYEATAIEDYLNLYINFKLKVLEAEALKMDTVKSFIKELDGYRTQLAKPYFVDETVNEQLLLEAYSHLKKDIRASHILIMVDENANPEDTLKAYNKIIEIRDIVISGTDFAETAIEFSEDPSARDREAIPNQQRFKAGNKGDLGYFTVFNMVYPFENAAYNTGLNEVSPIIRTKYGYHILKITEINDAMGNAEVAHIFVALRPEATTSDSLRKVEKINNIYSKIQEGMSFEEAVLEYSEDKGSAKNQGKLSKFSSNRVVPEFVEVVDNLEIGEISKPLATAYGLHIIKLISVERPGTLEEESPKLKERLAKDQRSRKSEEAVISKIKKENKFKTYPKEIAAIFATIDSTVLERKFIADSLSGMTKPVIKLKKDKYTQYDFAKFVQINQRPQDNIDKDVYLNQLFVKFEKESCLDYMDKNLESQYPEFKSLVQEYHDGILLFNLTDEKVWTKAVKDTIGLQEYFDDNRENYNWDERVNATVYKLKDNTVIEQVVTIINQYDNDGDIAKAIAEDSINSVRLIPDVYEKGDDKYVDMVEWKVGLSDALNSDVEELTVFVKIVEIIPPQQKELNEARGLVTADYQTYLEDKWISQLKEKYPVNVNNEVLEILIKDGK